MTNTDLGARQGYLLLADISGYTAFLTGTELEHAHSIIREVTKLIREQLVPPMRFVKLEGDAVFCYAEAQAFENGERFVELIEACYVAFANRLLDMARATTCPCDACAAIPSLDLKFITHYGSFMVENDDGREDLAGPDVILVHRLLKNRISEGGGPKAYAFFSAACQQRLPPSFELPRHREDYESFGETVGGVYDLKPVLERMREARREYVGPDDADLAVSFEMPFSAAVLWQYCVDADKRLRWQQFQTAVETQPNADGRMGAGAASHCAHGEFGGDALREYLDWRPFSYFTNRFTPLGNGPPVMPHSIETNEFIPTGGGTTSMHWRVKLEDRSEAAVSQIEMISDVLSGHARELMQEPLLKALEADGVAPGSGDNADFQEY